MIKPRKRIYSYLVRPIRKRTFRRSHRSDQFPIVYTVAKMPNPWRIKELAELALAFRYR